MLQRAAKFLWSILSQNMRRSLVRISQPTFTVSAAAVVSNPDGRILLLKHVLRASSGWGLPGGFLQAGEQPASAIKREIFEETGLEIENVKVFRIRTLGRHIEILFSASTAGTPQILSHEITDFGWFRPDELPEDLPAGQKQIIIELFPARFDKLLHAD